MNRTPPTPEYIGPVQRRYAEVSVPPGMLVPPLRRQDGPLPYFGIIHTGLDGDTLMIDSFKDEVSGKTWWFGFSGRRILYGGPEELPAPLLAKLVPKLIAAIQQEMASPPPES